MNTINTEIRIFNFSSYLAYTEDILNGNVVDPVYENPLKLEATKLNLHRMNRIYKHVKLNPELLAKVSSANKRRQLTIITEPWCGDAAQFVPVVARLVSESKGKLSLKLILRDENPDIMDQHLTNGSRSIPKLLVSWEDEPEEILWTWGPRPAFLQKYVQKAIREGLEADRRNQNVQKLYAKDKQISMQAELLRKLQ